jgi:hypothetical protein
VVINVVSEKEITLESVRRDFIKYLAYEFGFWWNKKCFTTVVRKGGHSTRAISSLVRVTPK